MAVHSAASDVTFRGNANELSLKGSALKADVRLTGATPRGKVQVEARVGSVYLGIDQKAAVSAHWAGGEIPGSDAARRTVDDVATLMAEQPAAHWLALTEGADCCVTPVLNMDEVAGHAWFTTGPGSC